MEILTLKRLEKMDACVSAIISFKEKFGSKARISKVYYELTHPRAEYLAESYKDWLVWLLAQDKELTIALLKQGADVNITDDNGSTPLHWAIRTESIESIEFLIEQGADVNAADDNGLTPLHWTTCTDNIKLAELLLEKGADINAADIYDRTPIHVQRAFGSIEIIKFLKSKGAK